jgi:hypothetical protein
MWLRAHRRRFYEPDATQIQRAEVSTTDVHGWDFFEMINSDQAGFSIGVQVPRCALTVELKKFGDDHHVLELDDLTTRSWARLDAHLTSPHRTRSSSTNSAPAGCGTKPSSPTTGGTTTTNPTSPAWG